MSHKRCVQLVHCRFFTVVSGHRFFYSHKFVSGLDQKKKPKKIANVRRVHVKGTKTETETKDQGSGTRTKTRHHLYPKGLFHNGIKPNHTSIGFENQRRGDWSPTRIDMDILYHTWFEIQLKVNLFARSMTSAVLYKPLRYLYLAGPSLGGYGMWQGVSAETLCATVAVGTDAVHWVHHPEMCQIIIDRKAESFAISVWIVVILLSVFTGTYFMIQALFMRHVYIQPVLCEMRAIAEHCTRLEHEDQNQGGTHRRYLQIKLNRTARPHTSGKALDNKTSVSSEGPRLTLTRVEWSAMSSRQRRKAMQSVSRDADRRYVNKRILGFSSCQQPTSCDQSSSSSSSSSSSLSSSTSSSSSGPD
jgi:hypothetical protein